MEKKVHEISEDLTDIDVFIISSKIYQESMKEGLLEKGISEGKIFELYEKTDVFDFTIMVPLLLSM